MSKISTPQYGELTESEFDLKQPTSTHLRRRATVIAVAAVIAAGSVHGGMTIYQHLKTEPTSVTSSETDTSSPISIPQSVAASCGPGSTSPSQAFNESDASAWVCHQNGTGTVLTIVLNPGDSVSSVSIVPGFQHVSGNIDGLQYRVPSEVRWKVEGQIDRSYALWQRKQDNLVPNIWNTLRLSAPMTNVKISLTVLETKSPAGFNLPADAPFAVQQIYLWR
jgi:hypothetical protein